MYPRSVPYQPPPAEKPAVPPAPPSQRWLLWLAVATVGAVALMVAVGLGGVYLLLRPLRDADLPAAGVAPTPPNAVHTDSAVPTVPHDTRPIVANAKPVDPKRKAADRDLLAESLGTLTGAHLYQSYLNLGLLADATEHGAYSVEEARKLLEEVLKYMENVDQQLNRLTGSDLEIEEKKRVESCRRLTVLLRTQAGALRAYWDTSEKDKEARKERETKYHKAREEAWNALTELLDLKE
jgi:hypothetical protein